MTSIIDKLRKRLASDEDQPEIEEVEEIEPNPLEADVLAGSGLEVNELVTKITQDRKVDLVDASRGIYRALEEGHVRLVDPNPPSSLPAYFGLTYSAWFWLVVGFTLLLIYSIYLMPQIYPLIYLRYAAGVIYVLYIPGFTLIEALYPKKAELERLERLGLDIGLSLALVPLVGLVLNYTPWGIRLDPIFTSLIILTMILGLVGVYRKYNVWQLSHRIFTQPEKPKKNK